MQLTLPTFAGLRASAIAAAQAACTTLLDLTSGSPARALIEADLSAWQVVQLNVYRVLGATRLSTSIGPDVDSFIADWGCPAREPAVAASGQVTLSRFVSLGSATVLVGQTVMTGDTTQSFAVAADPALAGWSATLGTAGGYVLAAGVSSLTVPVVAVTPGSAGNVVTGAISLFGSALAGIDTVANATPTTGGANAETDAAVRSRFALWILGLEKATLAAVRSAIADVQQGLTYLVDENVDEGGRFRPGHFVVTVDDGSGSPSAALKSAVYSAVDAVRPVASTFSVQSPSVTEVAVALTLTVSSGNKTILLAPLQAAIAAYVNGTPVGGTVSVSRIGAIAWSCSPTVANVTAVTLNGLAADIVAPATGVIKCAAVSIS